MSLDFIAQLEAEVAKQESVIPNSEQLTDVAELAYQQIQLENLTVKINDLAGKVSDALKLIKEKKLPDAIHSLGLSEFKLEDGTKISVSKVYFPSIKDEDKAEAYAWLVSTGHDIVKSEVKVAFAKGRTQDAEEAFSALASLGMMPTKSETIHWQTFRGWAKEVMEKGLPVPETINIHITDQAKIKRVS